MASEKQTTSKRKVAFTWAVALFAMVNVALYSYMTGQGNKFGKRELTLEALRATNYEKRTEGPWVWWVTKTFLAQPRTPDVVLLGSSQMGSAIFSAEAEHRGAIVDTTDDRQVTRLAAELARAGTGKPEVFNFSMGGAMVSDHYLMANTLFKGEHKPKVAIIGVNPRDFIDNNLPSASATDTFHFLSGYADLEKLAPVSFDDSFGYLDYLINRHLPLKKANLLVYGDLPPSLGTKPSFTNPEGKGAVKSTEKKPVTTQVLRAISGSAGDVKKGEWVLPAFPPYLYMDNSKEYIKRYKNEHPRCAEGQRRYFEELLSFLADQDIKVIVVGMPSQACNRQLLSQGFWTEFRGFLARTTQNHGGTYVDLFDDKRFLAGKDYLDTVHLNRWGGGKLVKAIAEATANRADIVASLKNKQGTAIGGRPGAERKWQ